jgi:hypothetical protein
MIFDSNRLDANHFANRRFDVCIAGAGVAGIVAARRLAAEGLRIALLEAGDREYSAASQDFYSGDVVGHEYFDLAATRLRFLGGTSNHWGGMCRPLDAVDFEAKEYAEWSGWPIRRSDLDPYLSDAASILDIDTRFDGDVISLQSPSDNLMPITFQYSRPTRLREKYADELEESETIEVYLNLALVDILLTEMGGAVENFACRRGNVGEEAQILIEADFFVLAMGGLEVPRLLLNCNQQIQAGIGNQEDLVGRFFMEHPHFTLGHLLSRDPRRPAFLAFASGKERLRSLMCRSDLMHSIGNLISGNQITCTSLQFWAPTAKFMKEKEILNCGLIVSADFDSNAIYSGELRALFEQMPNPNSRVMLADTRDPYGLRRIALDWQLSEIDKRTALECAIEVGKTIANLDTGRLRLVDWLISEDGSFPGLDEDAVGGNHHMGTTRMASNPERGVVDPDCRVFGTDNLFVAGSSVFPTSGHAHPTVTIAQLTLRVSDHIARLVNN